MIWKRQNLKISNRFGKDAKKQPVRQKAWHIPKIWSAAYRHTGRNLCNSFKKNEAEEWSIQYSTYRKKWLLDKTKTYYGRTDLRTLWGEHNHTGTQPLQLFPEKEDYTTGKTERHPLGEKQTIEADCQSGGEISDYLSTALKGWGIWVSNRLPGK